ncbi:MAG: MFS transporter [Bacteroidales bacterium]|nr:MFS transporter [Bacteroidales bacterium]
MSLKHFFSISAPSGSRVAAERQDKVWRRLRMQSFLAFTLSYALYYVCRLSLGVMKQPIIDAGLMNATQLGIVGACLYWTYAVGKLVNGFLADGANIKRFMATGLVISAGMNLVMGIVGVSAISGNIANAALFPVFALCWALNGWAQSMGAPPAIVGLSRWFPLRIRGTFYGFFSASHNIGEALSFLFVGLLVAHAGWRWGFFGAAAAGAAGILLILLFLHDTPQSKGLPPIEELSGEAQGTSMPAKSKNAQREVLCNPGIWVLALASAFMYMSRYAINEWGTIFLQEAKGYDLAGAAAIIAINPVFGVIGTVVSGWLTDYAFQGDRKWTALVAGILESIALALFLFGGPSRFLNITAMVLFGIAIGVLISFLPGLMAIDLVPREASGAAIGITGIASYAAAGIQMVVTGLLLDGHVTASGVHDYTCVSWFWLGAAIISFLLPILIWRRKN